MATPRPALESTDRRRRTTALACLGLAFAMVGAAYASVPLYNLFCRLTGYDGTPLVSSVGPAGALDRTMTVRFDANVAPGLLWSFAPESREIRLRIGETRTVFFRVRNEGSSASTGTSTFNVSPGQAGAFFVKMKCFCFEEQTLAAGESMDFPVVFYLDPALAEEQSLAGLDAVTLSYTYFAVKGGRPVAAAPRSQL